MSDIHAMPLLGHDLPEYIPPRARHKARVWPRPDGWRWEHECAPGWWKDSGFPYIDSQGAHDGALKHLRECC